MKEIIRICENCIKKQRKTKLKTLDQERKLIAMSDVFRIMDKFHITGKGIIYTIKISKGAILRLNDLLFDLHKNPFKIKEIEMYEIFMADVPYEERPVGIMLEAIGKAEPEGTILVRDITKLNYLFCNNPLYPRRVDEDYKEEYQAASFAHPCALFSYEDLERGKLSLFGEEFSGLTIYRGWMMKPYMYKNLYFQLEEKGIFLINTPEEYEHYHLLPGWYKDFKEETVKSVWTAGKDIKEVLNITEALEGSYIVKDYVKSRKHEWYEACFIGDVQNKNTLTRIVKNFIERQDKELTGGIVLRKFEHFKQIGFHAQSGMPLSEEYRVFVYAGRILAIVDYWNEESDIKFSDKEYQWIESIAARVKSNFVTVDLARKEDGSLIILEFGDGQVSGLLQLKADDFYRGFKDCNNYYINSELYCFDDLDFSKWIGSFAVKDGVTYRETAYWTESALFDLHDIKKETELIRVAKEELQERFQSFAQCSYCKVHYKIYKIQNGNVYFSSFTNTNKIYCYPLEEIDEIWIQRNYGGGRIEIEILYQKSDRFCLTAYDHFYLEEMYNGNLMISYLEEELNWSTTKKLLKKLYRDRISFGEPDLIGLVTDECISCIRIDGKEFDFTQDLAYGLISISPKSAEENKYIREICAYFNQI